MNLKDTAKKKINLIIQFTWPLFFLVISRFCDGRSMAYLAASAEGYILLLLLFLYGMPQVMEKMMRSRISKGQFKNAGTVFKSGALITFLFAGAVGCILFGISEVYAVSVLQMPFAALTLKILSVFFVLAALILLFQGFFQGTGSYMPTLVSGAGFAALMTVGGILFILLFEAYGQKAAALLQNEAVSGMYVSAGAAMGIAVAGAVPLLLFVFLYFGTGRRLLRQWKKEGLKRTEDLSRSGRTLVLSSFSVSSVFFLYRLPAYLGILFFQGGTKGAGAEALGSYYGTVELTGLFFVLLLSIGLVRSQNAVAGAIRHEEIKAARENLNAGVQWSMIAALFIPAYSMGAGTSILHLLFPQMKGTEEMLTAAGIGTVVFLLSVLFLGINLAVGLKRQVSISLLSATAVYLVIVLGGLKLTGNHIYVLICARMMFGAVVCGMNGFYLCRQIRFRLEWVRTVVFPIICAGVTGLILFLLKKALYTYLGDGLMLLLSLVIGMLCYLILLFVFKCFQRKELRMMPGGQILEKAGSFFHLL